MKSKMDKEFLEKVERHQSKEENASKDLKELLLFEKAMKFYAEESRASQQPARTSGKDKRESFDPCDIRTNFEFAKKAFKKEAKIQKENTISLFKEAFSLFSDF